MARDDGAFAEAIFGAICAVAKPEGVRVNEICRALSNGAGSHEVEAALQRLLRAGRVKRNDLKGTWRLVDTISPSSPPVAPPPVRRPTGRRGVAEAAPVTLPVVDDQGIPTEVDDDGVVDVSQRAVIREAVAARQVVAAGPGFGKTAVACGRVAWLLRDGVEPAKILLLSFTRTAVREMRARILELARGVPDANGVEVRTIDSFAWRLRTGLSERPNEGQGYTQNIDDTASMLGAPSPEVREYLDGFDHVVVDEAQDLVGARARLIATMLRSLRPDAGWTVFLDPAQAIYDWSEECDGSRGPQPTFEELLAALTPPPTRRQLQHLHRTRDVGLRALLLGARKLVLDGADDAYRNLRSVLDARVTGEPLVASAVGDSIAACGCAPEELLVLVRRRAEALEVSSRLTEKGIAHRLRFGGLPHVAAPWIAPVLNHACLQTGDTRVVRIAVEDAWTSVVEMNSWLTTGWTFEQAWSLLRRLGKGGTKSTIDIAAVATRLAGQSLPDDVVQREVGAGGPILSTVHGSKGRESRHALLFLTHQREAELGEARVMYVGLSRAKERLDVRTLRAAHWRYLDHSGRPWRKTEAGHQQVEVGRAGDLDLARTVEVAALELNTQQALLATFDGRPRAIHVETSEARAWVRYATVEDSSVPLAALSRDCEDDLRAIARSVDARARTPMRVRHLRWFDLGSAGLSPEASMKVSLPEPWNSTRLFLAPVLVGPGVLFGASK